MLSGNFLDKLNDIAKIIRKNKNPFGGIQIILVGDLFQLEPIYDESEESKFCFEASCWKECIDNIVELKKIMRQDNSVFQKCLNEIRIGEISEETKKILFECSKKKIKNIDSDIIPTRLYSCNKDVDKINNEELIKLNNDIKEYFVESKISINKNNNYNIENEFLEMISNNLDKNSQYINKLELAIGAQVMLIKNIDTENGLVNGSRGIIVCFNHNYYPVVKFLNGFEKEIEPISWQFDFNDRFKITKKQIPLKLAWAISIHKSQGCTLDFVEISIGSSIFAYGQAYVALSRVRNLEGLFIKSLKFKKIKPHPKVLDFYKNINNSLKI